MCVPLEVGNATGEREGKEKGKGGGEGGASNNIRTAMEAMEVG